MLNIYVPEHILLGGGRSADVMVWLTGGALLIGSNDIGKSRVSVYIRLEWMHRNAFFSLSGLYNPIRFMQQDVIMVSVNYR